MHQIESWPRSLLKATFSVFSLFLASSAASQSSCHSVDFSTIAVPHDSVDVELDALRLAYSGLLVSDDMLQISVDGSAWIEIGSSFGRAPEAILHSPSVREQFSYIYPLTYDLESRTSAYFDPGRPRNEDFFRMLYGGSRQEVEPVLTTVREPRIPSAYFVVTTRQGVSCQLAAALSEIPASGLDPAPYFESPGGGFVWRTIAGTDRLSAHAFGIAVDLNPALGGYWKWRGEPEGRVGPYDGSYPEVLVRIFERYGFIWGGKWHHFDGMHFEYRPELILHARMMAQRS